MRQRTAIGAGQGLRERGMGQAAWVRPVPSGSAWGTRQRVTSKPRDPSLPMWWAIWRRMSRWRSSSPPRVPEAHAGVSQQLGGLQLGVPGGDAGFGRAASSGQPPVTDAFAGLGAAGSPWRSRRGLRRGTGRPSWLGASGALAGLVVLRGAAAPGDQVLPGAEPGHAGPGFGDGVRRGAPSPAGHRFGLGQLFLIRGQQPFDHRGQVLDVGGQPVAGEHLGQQAPACATG